MNIIKQKCKEADLLAARFYKSAAGDKERVARDWRNKVKEAADLVNLYTSDAQKCRKNLASNKAYLSKLIESVPICLANSNWETIKSLSALAKAILASNKRVLD